MSNCKDCEHWKEDKRCTCLTDISGKKIYEGDFVENLFGWRTTVKFMNGAFYPFVALHNQIPWHPNERKVVGNITDNIPKMKDMVYGTKRKIDILCTGEYLGHKFAILNLGTYPAAYVECKFKNVKSYKDKKIDVVDVYGGLTYYGEAYWDKSDKTTYIGWDYGHCSDFAGYEIEMPDELKTGGKMWTTQEIYEEVKKCIRRFKAIQAYGRWYKEIKIK